jgi:acyl carrier protein
MWNALHLDGWLRRHLRIAMPTSTPASCRPDMVVGVRPRSGGLRLEVRVRGVVADCLGVGTAELSPSVSLTEDLAADSLDFAEMALALEAEFGIAVPDGALEDVRTFEQLVATVDAQSGDRRRASRVGIPRLAQVTS